LLGSPARRRRSRPGAAPDHGGRGAFRAEHPSFAGIESFKGESFHTARWPKERVDFTGKRVGVIGTGATAVQLITEIAKEVGHLTVFQRTANYCAPLRNGPIDPETQAKIKASYPEIFKRTRETFASFIHDFDPRSVFDVTPEERQARFEELWSQPGFSKWLGNFRDIMSDRKANELFAEFVRNKIRARVKDPVVAEKLCPKDHPFGTKRVPLESGYYEQFNRPNVHKWADGPRTYLGIQSAGFPNLFTLVGPHNGATFCNIPRCIEQNVEWVTDCIRYMGEKGYTRIAATPEAEQEWTVSTNWPSAPCSPRSTPGFSAPIYQVRSAPS
jgi:cation diffusion facilitator CzcD-associated flavoprotein CzcO